MAESIGPAPWSPENQKAAGQPRGLFQREPSKRLTSAKNDSGLHDRCSSALEDKDTFVLVNHVLPGIPSHLQFPIFHIANQGP